MCKRSLWCHEISDLRKLQLLFYRGYVLTGLLTQFTPEAEAIDSELSESLKAAVYVLDELLRQQTHDDLLHLKNMPFRQIDVNSPFYRGKI